VQSAAPEVTVESADDETRLIVNTAYGRIYRVGLGVSNVAQQPRADFYPHASFRCEAASQDNVVTLTIQLPEVALAWGYRLFVRGPKGHRYAELTERDLIGQAAPNVLRYRWQRDASTFGDTKASAVLVAPLYHVYAPFTMPSLSQPAAR
jgi:hypothetical protein